MGKYDWLLDYKETRLYNYENDGKIVGYDLVCERIIKDEKSGMEKGVSVSWSYKDRGREFKYTGTAEIREKNLFIHSSRTDENEEVLTIFPIPSNYCFSMLWGVEVGTVEGLPSALRILWTTKRLTASEVKKEFKRVGATLENSFIAMNYNPDELMSKIEIEEKKNAEGNEGKVVWIDQIVNQTESDDSKRD